MNKNNPFLFYERWILARGSYVVIFNKSPVFNQNRPEFMVIGHQCRGNEFNDFPPIRADDKEIKRVEKVKTLGVIVDEGLRWKNQFKSLTGKLAGDLSSLNNLMNAFPQSKLCDVHCALFEI